MQLCIQLRVALIGIDCVIDTPFSLHWIDNAVNPTITVETGC